MGTTKQRQIIAALHVKPEIEPADEAVWRIQFLQDYLIHSQCDGLVLSISGGQDSALAGRLCQMAVERLRARVAREYRFIALRLPYGRQQDEEDAQLALRFVAPDQT